MEVVAVATPAAKVPGPPSAPPTGGESSTCFVGNLPWSATNESITAFFEGTAKVTEVRIRECASQPGMRDAPRVCVLHLVCM